jgi:hypothetical protein
MRHQIREAMAMMVIDHVVMAVSDLDLAGERLFREHGLASVPGGTHPRWGTANRIVPLGDQYVELAAVVDLELGSANAFGRRLLDLTADGSDRWAEVCVADPEIDAIAARLRLDVVSGLRTTPEGHEIRWRGVGLEAEAREPFMPFFIAWDVPDDRLPGRTAVTHRVPVTGIAQVEVGGDAERLAGWLDGASLPIEVVNHGEPGLQAVTFGLEGGGELEIRT